MSKPIIVCGIMLKHREAAERKAIAVAEYVRYRARVWKSISTIRDVSVRFRWTQSKARIYLHLAKQMGLVGVNDSSMPFRWFPSGWCDSSLIRRQR